MNIPSPFEGLDIDCETVCEFFAVFSRLEFALKDLGYVQYRYNRVSPSWRCFAKEVKNKVEIESGSKLEEAVNYLCGEPPKVQTDAQVWEQRNLHGCSKFEKAIDASVRVRNNLFHGGKHTPHSPPGRDQKLVESALVVLYACIKACPKLYEVYVQNQF